MSSATARIPMTASEVRLRQSPQQKGDDDAGWYMRNGMVDFGIEVLADEALEEIRAMTAAAIARIGDLSTHPADRYIHRGRDPGKGLPLFIRIYTAGVTPPPSINRKPLSPASAASEVVWWLDEAVEIDRAVWEWFQARHYNKGVRQ